MRLAVLQKSIICLHIRHSTAQYSSILYAKFVPEHLKTTISFISLRNPDLSHLAPSGKKSSKKQRKIENISCIMPWKENQQNADNATAAVPLFVFFLVLHGAVSGVSGFRFAAQ